MTPLYINEIAPGHLSGMLGSLHQLCLTLAIIFSYLFGYVMPKEGTDPEEARNAKAWRWAMAMPLMFAVIQVLSLVFVFKHDTPAFYASKGQWQEVRDTRTNG